MGELRFVRGDRYPLTCPITKDGVAFDLTTGGTWVTTATLGQYDVVKATTEAEVPGALPSGRCTLTVQNGDGFVSILICNSALLPAGSYDLELRTTDAPAGTAVYTWPSWTIRIVEPQRI